jgi:hypothetical protein
MADTSLQIMATENQDSLLGSVLYYEAPEFAFLLTSGDTLYFDRSAVRYIGSAPAPALPPPSISKAPFSLYQDLFFSASAWSLPARSIQARNTQFIWNQANFGATEHYSIAVGQVLPLYLLVKTKLASNRTENKFNMAAGLNILFSLLSTPDLPRGIHLYVASTIGSPDNYLNFNAGYMVDLSGNDRAFLFSGGGLFEISTKWNIVIDHLLLLDRGEYIFFPGMGISYGYRRHRVDLGYFYYTSFSNRITNAPGLGYTLNF